MMKTYFKNKKGTGGYTLLFAVLVSSLTLAVGISILNISKKEFLIVTSTRDSTAALYAADGGLECAIYANYTKNAFATDADTTANFDCNTDHSPITRAVDDPEGTFTFDIRLGSTGKSCAIVTVSKYLEIYPPTGEERVKTSIESRGYNTGWNEVTSQCDIKSAKRVERAFRYSSF